MKKELLTAILQTVLAKLKYIENEIKTSEESKNNDSKSSAGDKHETARAMAQIEIDKLRNQLSLTDKQYQALSQINADESPAKIGFGSIVQTNKACYFISIGLGKFVFKEQAIFCISLNSPIGALLLGKGIKEEFTFNAKTEQILAIY